MSRTRNERGQVVVLTVIALTVLLGMSALVLDVGAWFHSKRQLQATADASALAGAQMLPDTPGNAISTALDYANKNGGAVAGGDVTITSTNIGNDTISVAAKKQEPGYFARVFGLNVVLGRWQPFSICFWWCHLVSGQPGAFDRLLHQA